MPGRRERWSSPWAAALAVGVITLAGLLLRLPSFDDSLYGDELSTYFIVTGHSLGRVVELLQGNSVDLNPPLFMAAAWTTKGLADPAQSVRLVSLAAGTVAIPLTYLVGSRTVGRPAGLVGAALVALSPFLIFYTTEARAYGLLLALVALCNLLLLQALDTGRPAWWVAYAACSAALLYTHYTPVFLLAAQFAWAFATHPEARRRLVAANLAAAVAYLPWLPTVLDNTRSPGNKTIGILNPFGWEAVRTDLGRWSLGHPYIPLATVPGRLALATIAAGVAAGLVGLAAKVLRAAEGRLSARLPGRTVLILVLALATPVSLALYSEFSDTVWDTRNLTASWPGLALAAGALVTSAGRPLRILATGLLIGGFAIGAVKLLDSSHQRPDYGAAVSFIDRVGAPGDPVVELPAPTPGPLTPLADVARAGRPSAQRRPAFRLGIPLRSALVNAPPYASLPAPPPSAVARRAAAVAGSGKLFLVAPGSAPLGALRSANGVTARAAGLEPATGSGPTAALLTAALRPIAPFLRALPPDLSLIETRTFPGFLPISVYVFQAGPARPRGGA